MNAPLFGLDNKCQAWHTKRKEKREKGGGGTNKAMMMQIQIKPLPSVSEELICDNGFFSCAEGLQESSQQVGTSQEMAQEKSETGTKSISSKCV